MFTPASLPLIVSSEAKARASLSSAHALPSATPAGGGSFQPSSNAKSSSLSTGAQAGIGVAAAIVGIAVGAALMWYFIRRRSRRPANLEETELTDFARKEGHDPVIPGIPELTDEERSVEAPTIEKPQELFVEAAGELPQDFAAQEADNDDMRHELDAGYRGEQLDDITTPIDDAPPDYKKEKDG